ncbi:fructose-specific PTS transporter subunit EIIC [Nocardioides sp. GY 10127]|uniref:PTS fructose transporter subunit IIABC n=1 Tax=Nocardioides sp. GY 10127 TaxID=2569762 RepID=UPI0010A8DE72|nr:fructose-specific PTS transporter subunit EIIC [Nocardioides sp. GY 10127]TIC80897.1 PTS lactose transporter subunit IIC [Nocardioides sp. GY 10127]
MSDLITPALVRLDADLGSDKTEVIRALARIVGEAGRAVDVDQLAEDALARESTSPTGLNGGIAIPHCRTTGVSEPTLAFARLSPTVEFGAKDGAAQLVFLISAPDGGEATHLQLLTKLARALVRPEFTAALRDAATPEAAAAAIMDVVSPAPAGGAPAAAAAAAPAAPRSLVAVTACPTGIAHTYMAAEALEAAAKKAGVPLVVETQGSAGTTPLDPQVIEQASAVIFAVDVGVRDRARFAGKPVVSAGVKRAIDDADGMVAEALRNAADPHAPRVEGSVATGSSSAGTDNETWGQRTRRVLMTGVSYMIPFVSAGGLLIALGFLLGGYDITNAYGTIMVDNTIFNLPDPASLGLTHVLFDSGLMAYLGAIFFVLGKTAFVFFIPALGGYIAYAIADRPGIAPGFVAGGLAINVFGVANADGVSAPASGYLGAIVGGVLAGVLALWLANLRTPNWLRGLMPVLIIPLVTSLVIGFVMVAVVNRPLGWVMDRLTDGLNSMGTGSAVILGVVVGLMMAFDMGGPLNKVAYSVAVAGIGSAATLASDAPELRLMAAVMIAGMVPPLGLALATVVRKSLFTVAERENGKAAWLLGASFITEGAIPFAAADPLRVIPSIMLGSAVAGGLSEALGVGVRAPHGGIFVLFAVTNVFGYILAIVVGAIVAAAAVIALKTLWKRPEPVA